MAKSLCKILIIVFVLLSLKGFSQFEDTIRYSLKQKPALLLKFDSRNTFITSTIVRTLGLKAGVSYNNRLAFGLGYNQLVSDVERTRIIENPPFEPDTVNYQLKYFYFSPFVEYVFYKDPRWKLSIPVQIGVGQSRLETDEYNPPAKVLGKDLMISYEPAITAEYKIIPWFGIGAGVGYRLMIYGNKNLNEQFTAPVYIFKAKIFFKEILK